MSMNATPKAERLHIAFFGRRNAGKSSLINAVTGQQAAIVSDVAGTTTDPVYKTMEILPLGPCVLIDTAGLDDEGELGAKRVAKTLAVLGRTDLAVLVLDGPEGITPADREILARLKQKKIPVLVAANKADLDPVDAPTLSAALDLTVHAVSAITGAGIPALRQAIAQAVPTGEDRMQLLGDLIGPGDVVVLVTPIDRAAPKGRLILPQQQAIRDVLESDAVAVVSKEQELRRTLALLGEKPKLVITDSQAFLKVAADVPKDVLLTSFSILFARYKGDLEQLVRGARAIADLTDGDEVLIAEGCTHHQQSDDIGRVKIPRWLREMTGKELRFSFSAGLTYPEDLGRFALIVHCGACMLNRAEMQTRLAQAKEAGVPAVNYGVLIACVQGILPRVLEPFPLARLAWEEEI